MDTLRQLFVALKMLPKTMFECDSKKHKFELIQTKRYLRDTIKSIIKVDELPKSFGCAGWVRIGNLKSNTYISKKEFLPESIELARKHADPEFLKKEERYFYFDGKFYDKKEFFIHENKLYNSNLYTIYKGDVVEKKHLIKVLEIPYWMRNNSQFEKELKEAEQYIEIPEEQCVYSFYSSGEIRISAVATCNGFIVNDKFITSMFRFEKKRVMFDCYYMNIKLSEVKDLEFAPTKEHLEIIKNKNINVRFKINLKNCNTNKLRYLKSLINGKLFNYEDFPKVLEMIRLSLKGGKYEY